MKKILFLLLCTVSMYGQVSTGQEQEFDYGIKNNSTQTVTSSVNLVTQGVDGTYGKIALNINTKAFLSTGLIKNGLISANGDPTKFNITAGIGIISNFDDPENPTSTIINFPAFTGITPTYLLTGTITYVAINNVAAIVMQATPFTPEQRRSLIVLGAVIHSNLTTINVINNISAPTNASTNQLHDFIEAVGALNLTGNKYTANGANLQLNKSAGLIFKLGSNFANDWKNPHELAQTAGTSLTFRYRTQNGTEGSDRINLDPALYDLNNVLTAVPNNKFTIQTVTMFQSGVTRIQYGQNVYDDLATAKNAVFTRNFVVEPNSKENGIIRAYIIMKNTATSLQNVSDADILEAQKFGGVASGGVALTFANIVSALGYTPENVANKQNSLAVDGTGTKYPTVDAVNTLKWIKSNESLTLAQRKGDVLYGILDQYTGEEMTLSKATGTPTVDGIIYFQLGSEYFKRDADIYNVKWFGAKGDGTNDDTSAINLAFLNYKNIFIPKGTWLVSYINVFSNTVLSTDGVLTVIKQKSGLSVGTRILNIKGSNIIIGDLSFIGNISTDTDEQSHAVYIQANPSNGNISNVFIGNVYANDIRGDGVYIGQLSSLNIVSNITVGNVYVNNIYRNGVSIVSANNVTVESVTGDKIGYFIMDVEANINSGVCTNIKVGYIKGRTFGLVSPTSSDYIDKVEIERMDLDPVHNSQSTPSYSYGIAVEDGLQLRNVKSVKINHLKINGFNRSGIFTITGNGELGAEDVQIGSLQVRNCALTDVVYNAFLNLPNTTVSVDYLDIEVSVANKRGVSNLTKGVFNNIKASITTNSSLFSSSSNLEIKNITQIGTGSFGSTLTKSIIKNGNIIGSKLAGNSLNLSFENVTATATESIFTSGSGYDDHNISNSTFNGVYYPLQSNKFVKFGGTSSQRLMADGSVNSDVYASTSSNTNYIPKASSSTAFSNSIMYESGGFIGINKTNPNFTLDVVKFGAPAINAEISGSYGQTFTMRRNGAGNPVGLGIRNSGELSFYSNNIEFGWFSLNGNLSLPSITLLTSPTTSASTYEFLTRNTSTGLVEKVLSNTVATVASPTLTGTPTAPTATVGTNTTQLATTAFVQGIRPYKVYVGLIFQTGTSDPTVTVLENNLGGTVVWTRDSVGLYRGTLTGAFPTNKTAMTANSFNSNIGCTAQTDYVQIAVNADGALATNNAHIEIRVYN